MITSLPPELLAELSVRTATTALIVIGVALAVERLGPAIGGALAGLPIVIGPGFLFVIREHSAAFTADAGAASLLSLGATEAFLLVYCAVAFRQRAGVALAAAALVWLAGVFLLSFAPLRPLSALVLFFITAAAARWVSRRFLSPADIRKPPRGYRLLIVRGVAAGLLVAGTTLAAGYLGSGWAGFIMTYPIGLSIISITVHQRVGAPAAIAMLRSAMLGVASIAAFSFTLALSVEAIDPLMALMLALLASLASTSLLAWRSTRPVRG